MNDSPHKVPPRAMPAWAAWAVLAVVVAVAGLSSFFLIRSFGAGRPEDNASLEALRLAGQIVLGTGGVAALFLAVRRQRWTELTLDHQREVARDSAKDALERRITELYSKAADQIGNEKAPVRLAGLISLDRLGEDSHSQRTKVVDVLCSYLRMPPPLVVSSGGGGEKEVDPQEMEVRRAAQRMLCKRAATSDPESHWPGMTVDLRGAVLFDFTIDQGVVRELKLSRAHFYGPSSFKDCKVDGDLSMAEAIVEDKVNFSGLVAHELDLTRTRFVKDADFNTMRLSGEIVANAVEFGDRLEFIGVEIAGQAHFVDARFADCAFSGTRFIDHVQFTKAIFRDYASFKDVTFGNYGTFVGCTFKGSVSYDDTYFEGKAEFYNSVIEGHFSCERGRFVRDTNFHNVQFASAVDFLNTTFQGEAWFPRSIFGDAVKYPKEYDIRWVTFDGCILHRPIHLRECVFYDRLWVANSSPLNLSGASAVADIRHQTPGWRLDEPGTEDSAGRRLAKFVGQDPDEHA